MIELDVFELAKVATPFDISLIMSSVQNGCRVRSFQN